MAVNYSGIIRGSIQRVTKLVLYNEDRNLIKKLIFEIDLLFNEFENKKEYHIYMIDSKFKSSFNDSKTHWNMLKNKIDIFWKNNSEENRHNIINESEICWVKANNMVFKTQSLSESRLNFFGLIFIFIGINIILGLFVIWFIRSYVNNQLEFLANYDSLTNTLNRHSFKAILDKEISYCKRYNSKLSFITFDIDYFKNLNDQFGHQAGDKILINLSKLVFSGLRDSDYLFRIGGEEFVVLTKNLDIKSAMLLADRLREKIEKHNFDIAHKVTASFGISQYKSDDTTESLYKRADKALYIAKSSGRNKVKTII